MITFDSLHWFYAWGFAPKKWLDSTSYPTTSGAVSTASALCSPFSGSSAALRSSFVLLLLRLHRRRLLCRSLCKCSSLPLAYVHTEPGILGVHCSLAQFMFCSSTYAAYICTCASVGGCQRSVSSPHVCRHVHAYKHPFQLPIHSPWRSAETRFPALSRSRSLVLCLSRSPAG